MRTVPAGKGEMPGEIIHDVLEMLAEMAGALEEPKLNRKELKQWSDAIFNAMMALHDQLTTETDCEEAQRRFEKLCL